MENMIIVGGILAQPFVPKPEKYEPSEQEIVEIGIEDIQSDDDEFTGENIPENIGSYCLDTKSTLLNEDKEQKLFKEQCQEINNGTDDMKPDSVSDCEIIETLRDIRKSDIKNTSARTILTTESNDIVNYQKTCSQTRINNKGNDFTLLLGEGIKQEHGENSSGGLLFPLLKNEPLNVENQVSNARSTNNRTETERVLRKPNKQTDTKNLVNEEVNGRVKGNENSLLFMLLTGKKEEVEDLRKNRRNNMSNKPSQEKNNHDTNINKSTILNNSGSMLFSLLSNGKNNSKGNQFEEAQRIQGKQKSMESVTISSKQTETCLDNNLKNIKPNITRQSKSFLKMQLEMPEHVGIDEEMNKQRNLPVQARTNSQQPQKENLVLKGDMQSSKNNTLDGCLNTKKILDTPFKNIADHVTMRRKRRRQENHQVLFGLSGDCKERSNIKSMSRGKSSQSTTSEKCAVKSPEDILVQCKTYSTRKRDNPIVNTQQWNGVHQIQIPQEPQTKNKLSIKNKIKPVHSPVEDVFILDSDEENLITSEKNGLLQQNDFRYYTQGNIDKNRVIEVTSNNRGLLGQEKNNMQLIESKINLGENSKTSINHLLENKTSNATIAPVLTNQGIIYLLLVPNSEKSQTNKVEKKGHQNLWQKQLNHSKEKKKNNLHKLEQSIVVSSSEDDDNHDVLKGENNFNMSKQVRIDLDKLSDNKQSNAKVLLERGRNINKQAMEPMRTQVVANIANNIIQKVKIGNSLLPLNSTKGNSYQKNSTNEILNKEADNNSSSKGDTEKELWKDVRNINQEINKSGGVVSSTISADKKELPFQKKNGNSKQKHGRAVTKLSVKNGARRINNYEDHFDSSSDDTDDVNDWETQLTSKYQEIKTDIVKPKLAEPSITDLGDTIHNGDESIQDKITNNNRNRKELNKNSKLREKKTNKDLLETRKIVNKTQDVHSIHEKEVNKTSKSEEKFKHIHLSENGRSIDKSKYSKITGTTQTDVIDNNLTDTGNHIDPKQSEKNSENQKENIKITDETQEDGNCSFSDNNSQNDVEEDEISSENEEAHRKPEHEIGENGKREKSTLENLLVNGKITGETQKDSYSIFSDDSRKNGNNYDLEESEEDTLRIQETDIAESGKRGEKRKCEKFTKNSKITDTTQTDVIDSNLTDTSNLNVPKQGEKNSENQKEMIKMQLKNLFDVKRGEKGKHEDSLENNKITDETQEDVNCSFSDNNSQNDFEEDESSIKNEEAHRKPEHEIGENGKRGEKRKRDNLTEYDKVLISQKNSSRVMLNNGKITTVKKTRKRSAFKSMKKCPHCPAIVTRGYLKIHIISVHGDEKDKEYFRCSECDYKSVYKGRLRQHLIYKHTEPERMMNQMKKCDKCPKMFKDKKGLQRHMGVHNERITLLCANCDYKTICKLTLQRHMEVHTYPDKLYKCPLCDFMTRNRSKETYHKNVFHTKRFFYCHSCDYKSKHSQRLQLHLLQHKAVLEEKDYKYRCDKCDYKAIKDYSLTVHKLKHLEPQEIQYFYCYHCDFKAKRKDNLKTHVLRHIKKAEKLQCIICEFTTTNKYILVCHIDEHLENKNDK